MRDVKILNLAFLADRIKDLDLKQWWLAEQIGVDRKTVERWLNGHVKRIRAENLMRLARCLNCRSEELALSEDAEAFATRSEQLATARLIQQEALIETLGPPGHWRMLESLIRVVLRPDLPLPVLGELYNQLSIAAWRQSHLDRGETYASRALGIGRRCHSKSVIASATLNLATLASFRGRLAESLVLYERCIASRYLADEVTRAKAMSNYGATYLDAGEFTLAIKWQRRAIRSFRRLRRPMNESIAWIGLAQALKKLGRAEAAWKACGAAESLARRASYRRGICDAALNRAELLAARHQTTAAAAELKSARAGYRALHIREAQPEATGALIARLEGRYRDAERHIATGLKLAKGFPIDRVRLLAEYAALEGARGRTRSAARAEARHKALLKRIRGIGDRSG